MPPTTISSTGATPFPYDPVRTAIALMYHERGMIADRVLPPAPRLSKPEFKYVTYDKSDAFVVPDARLGRRGEPREIEFSGEEVVDKTEHFGLQGKVPVEDQDAAADERSDPVDVEVLKLRRLLLLGREVRVSAKVSNPASYGADYRMALQNNANWDDDAADVIGHLETAMNTPIMRPNVAVFGQAAWSALRRHPKILKATNKASGADSGLATRMAVAELLEIDEVLVGRTRVASSLEGQDLALKRTWGDIAAFIYRGAFEGVGAPGGRAGSEAQEAGVDDALTSSMEMETFGFSAEYLPLDVRTRFNEALGAKGVTQVVVRESRKEVICGGSAFGYLITNCTG